MKKLNILLIGVLFSLTSCYSYTSVVGKGQQENKETTEKNHYIFWGLVPVKVSDTKKMSEGKKDYTIKHEQSFIDGLLSILTGGIYTPTTTTVIKDKVAPIKK